ncbi:MAG: hypothetical protein AB7R90_19640 [Reyranellaceae bacterium]
MPFRDSTSARRTGLAERRRRALPPASGGAALGILGGPVIQFPVPGAGLSHTSLLVSLGTAACMYGAAQHPQVSNPIATAGHRPADAAIGAPAARRALPKDRPGDLLRFWPQATFARGPQ